MAFIFRHFIHLSLVNLDFLICIVFSYTALAQALSFSVSLHRQKFDAIPMIPIGSAVKLRIAAPHTATRLPVELSPSGAQSEQFQSRRNNKEFLKMCSSPGSR